MKRLLFAAVLLAVLAPSLSAQQTDARKWLSMSRETKKVYLRGFIEGVAGMAEVYRAKMEADQKIIDEMRESISGSTSPESRADSWAEPQAGPPAAPATQRATPENLDEAIALIDKFYGLPKNASVPMRRTLLRIIFNAGLKE